MRGAFLPFSMVVAGSLLGCARDPGFRPPVAPETTRAEVPSGSPSSASDLARGASAPNVAPDQVGLATWYGAALAGRKTASGERFDPNLYTAAHRTLPIGTWVEVRRVETGRAVRVRINDRGPNTGDARRIIDLSRRAASDLDLLREGVARVEVRVVRGP